ncbi:MAG: bifunctional DNA-formamidopyrimidine glycosylase/DNA-(apurinic or apyrimidinic site) lyase [Patescibacteria group bacterium]
MPELPEVETVRLQLLRKVVGRTIADVGVLHPKSVANDDNFQGRLAGKTIEHIDRVGKLMIFSFKNENDLYLLAHLKMTGQFFFVDTRGDVVGGGHTFTKVDLKLPTKHTRVVFRFTDGTTLYFNDMRLFGYTKLADAEAAFLARSGYGPEPIDPNFDCEWFVTEVRRRKAPIKAVLLDQSFVAGLGNIYADEALWHAKIRPTRRADTLTRKEAAALATAARDVLQESITAGGTTFQHFADTNGDPGNFIDHLKVFGKQGEACERCGTTIKKIRTAGRGTHYCPGCQK